MLFGTAFGRAWCWHLGFTLLLVLTAAPQRWFGIAPALAGLALASLGFVGHAADQPGWAGLGRELNQSLHLLAAGLWLGGLLPLGWLLHQARRAGATSFPAIAREAVPPFSQMGYAAVAVIALTGSLNTLILVGSAGALVDTAYGRLLALKIALYLTMVAIALVNRFRLSPMVLRERMTGTPAAALYRSVLIEQAVGVAVLVAVSVLGTWPPPR